jgi:hypothetical protein
MAIMVPPSLQNCKLLYLSPLFQLYFFIIPLYSITIIGVNDILILLYYHN